MEAGATPAADLGRPVLQVSAELCAMLVMKMCMLRDARKNAICSPTAAEMAGAHFIVYLCDD